MLTLRLVFHLALRQAKGFACSVLALLGLDMAVPDHTTLSRRGRAFADRPGRLRAGTGRAGRRRWSTAKTPGNASLLTPEQRLALVQAVEDGPVPATGGVIRWRLVDLMQWVWDRFAISISRQTLGRELRALQYR